MDQNRGKPFQFRLGSLLRLILLVCVALVAWQWMPFELQLFVVISFAVVAGIAAMEFFQAALVWLMIGTVSRLIRLFRIR